MRWKRMCKNDMVRIGGGCKMMRCGGCGVYICVLCVVCVVLRFVVVCCLVYKCWSYGVMVSTLDSESSDPGSNPGRTSFLTHTHTSRTHCLHLTSR